MDHATLPTQGCNVLPILGFHNVVKVCMTLIVIVIVTL